MLQKCKYFDILADTFKDCASMQSTMTNEDADFGEGWLNSTSEIDEDSHNDGDDKISTNTDILLKSGLSAN